MRSIMQGLVLGGALVLGGCAYQPVGTVQPQVDGSYKLVNTGSNESNAMKAAQQDAKGTCKNDKKKRYVVVEQNSDYIGVKVNDGSKSGLAGVGMSLLQAAADHKNKENYQVVTVIKCQ